MIVFNAYWKGTGLVEKVHLSAQKLRKMSLQNHFNSWFGWGQSRWKERGVGSLTCSPAPGRWGPSPALPSPPFPWRWGFGRGCGAGWEESLGSETGSSAGSTCARHRCKHAHIKHTHRGWAEIHTSRLSEKCMCTQRKWRKKKRKSACEWTSSRGTRRHYRRRI